MAERRHPNHLVSKSIQSPDGDEEVRIGICTDPENRKYFYFLRAFYKRITGGDKVLVESEQINRRPFEAMENPADISGSGNLLVLSAVNDTELNEIVQNLNDVRKFRGFIRNLSGLNKKDKARLRSATKKRNPLD